MTTIDLSAVIAKAREDPRILALYLLGSFARNEAREDSDVDLGIAATGDFGPLERAEFAAESSLALGREIDAGELSSKDLIYAREAILGGRRIYVRDEGKADLLAATLLGMYANFEIERREVVDAYTA